MSFPDVPDRVHRSVCLRCRRTVQAQEVVLRVWTCAGVASADGFGRDNHANNEAEAVHVDCAKAALALPARRLGRVELRPKVKMPPPVDVRAPDYQCLKCGKVFERGDRFVLLHRAAGIGRDPETNQPGLIYTEGVECAHLDCADPKVTGVGLGLVLS